MPASFCIKNARHLRSLAASYSYSTFFIIVLSYKNSSLSQNLKNQIMTTNLWVEQVSEIKMSLSLPDGYGMIVADSLESETNL